jgi:hypothetical protein
MLHKKVPTSVAPKPNEYLRMNSAEFRKRYAKLREPVVVVAYGRPIGTWFPTRWVIDTPRAVKIKRP